MMFPLVLLLAAGASPLLAQVTFNKDIAPILQRSCQSCHRPGEVGPMPLLTFQDTRKWARAIREAVRLKKMPPWFADPSFGHFSNDSRLTPAEIELFSKWAAAGAPEGDPKDLPKPVQFVDGWNIGKPDLVIEMPNAFPVPAKGVIEYQAVVIPTGFKQDMWIQAAELRPGARAVVHHVTAFSRRPGSRYLSEAKPGIPYVRDKSKPQPVLDREIDRAEYVVGYTPGRPASRFLPGQARLIPAGSDIVLSLHYTPNGTAAEDRTKIGFIFSKEPPKQRVVNVLVGNSDIRIPPGAPSHRVDAAFTLQSDAQLVRMWPHMHARGKSFEFRVTYPQNENQVLLRVPQFDFNWQLSYNLDKPLYLPKGSRIECIGYFDNSPNNRFNPDPTAEVRFGDQSWEEMMEGYVDLAIDAKASPESLRKPLTASR